MLLHLDIARLVLGYLAQENCVQSFQYFLSENRHLASIRPLFTEGISSPYMSTLSVFGKTLCQILDEYSAMKQTEACYLRNKNEEANSTAKLSEMWKKVEEAMSALRSYQIASLLDARSHNGRSSSEGCVHCRKQVKVSSAVIRCSASAAPTSTTGNPACHVTAASTSATSSVATATTAPPTPPAAAVASSSAPTFHVENSFEANRRGGRRAKTMPKRLSDTQRQEIIFQDGADRDTSSKLLRDMTHNEVNTMAVVGATIMTQMKKCSRTSDDDKGSEVTSSSIDAEKMKHQEQSIATLTLESLLDPAELISQDSSELTKELEELLSLDNRPDFKPLINPDQSSAVPSALGGNSINTPSPTVLPPSSPARHQQAPTPSLAAAAETMSSRDALESTDAAGQEAKPSIAVASSNTVDTPTSKDGDRINASNEPVIPVDELVLPALVEDTTPEQPVCPLSAQSDKEEPVVGPVEAGSLSEKEIPGPGRSVGDNIVPAIVSHSSVEDITMASASHPAPIAPGRDDVRDVTPTGGDVSNVASPGNDVSSAKETRNDVCNDDNNQTMSDDRLSCHDDDVSALSDSSSVKSKPARRSLFQDDVVQETNRVRHEDGTKSLSRCSVDLSDVMLRHRPGDVIARENDEKTLTGGYFFLGRCRTDRSSADVTSKPTIATSSTSSRDVEEDLVVSPGKVAENQRDGGRRVVVHQENVCGASASISASLPSTTRPLAVSPKETDLRSVTTSNECLLEEETHLNQLPETPTKSETKFGVRSDELQQLRPRSASVSSQSTDASWGRTPRKVRNLFDDFDASPAKCTRSRTPSKVKRLRSSGGGGDAKRTTASKLSFGSGSKTSNIRKQMPKIHFISNRRKKLNRATAKTKNNKEKGVRAKGGKPRKTVVTVDKTRDSVSKTMGSVNKTMGSIDKTTPSVSKTMDSLDETTPSVSKTMDSLDKTMPSISKTMDSVDKTMPSISKTMDSVDKTTPSVSKTMYNVDKTMPSISKTMDSVDKRKKRETEIDCELGEEQTTVESVATEEETDDPPCVLSALNLQSKRHATPVKQHTKRLHHRSPRKLTTRYGLRLIDRDTADIVTGQSSSEGMEFLSDDASPKREDSAGRSDAPPDVIGSNLLPKNEAESGESVADLKDANVSPDLFDVGSKSKQLGSSASPMITSSDITVDEVVPEVETPPSHQSPKKKTTAPEPGPTSPSVVQEDVVDGDSAPATWPAVPPPSDENPTVDERSILLDRKTAVNLSGKVSVPESGVLVVKDDDHVDMNKILKQLVQQVKKSDANCAARGDGLAGPPGAFLATSGDNVAPAEPASVKSEPSPPGGDDEFSKDDVHGLDDDTCARPETTDGHVGKFAESVSGPSFPIVESAGANQHSESVCDVIDLISSPPTYVSAASRNSNDDMLVSSLCAPEVTGDSLTLLLNETSLTQVMSAAREASEAETAPNPLEPIPNLLAPVPNPFDPIPKPHEPAPNLLGPALNPLEPAPNLLNLAPNALGHAPNPPGTNYQGSGTNTSQFSTISDPTGIFSVLENKEPPKPCLPSQVTNLPEEQSLETWLNTPDKGAFDSERHSTVITPQVPPSMTFVTEMPIVSSHKIQAAGFRGKERGSSRYRRLLPKQLTPRCPPGFGSSQQHPGYGSKQQQLTKVDTPQGVVKRSLQMQDIISLEKTERKPAATTQQIVSTHAHPSASSPSTNQQQPSVVASNPISGEATQRIEKRPEIDSASSLEQVGQPPSSQELIGQTPSTPVQTPPSQRSAANNSSSTKTASSSPTESKRGNSPATESSQCDVTERWPTTIREQSGTPELRKSARLRKKTQKYLYSDQYYEDARRFIDDQCLFSDTVTSQFDRAGSQTNAAESTEDAPAERSRESGKTDSSKRTRLESIVSSLHHDGEREKGERKAQKKAKKKKKAGKDRNSKCRQALKKCRDEKSATSKRKKALKKTRKRDADKKVKQMKGKVWSVLPPSSVLHRPEVEGEEENIVLRYLYKEEEKNRSSSEERSLRIVESSVEESSPNETTAQRKKRKNTSDAEKTKKAASKKSRKRKATGSSPEKIERKRQRRLLKTMHVINQLTSDDLAAVMNQIQSLRTPVGAASFDDGVNPEVASNGPSPTKTQQTACDVRSNLASRLSFASPSKRDSGETVFADDALRNSKAASPIASELPLSDRHNAPTRAEEQTFVADSSPPLETVSGCDEHEQPQAATSNSDSTQTVSKNILTSPIVTSSSETRKSTDVSRVPAFRGPDRKVAMTATVFFDDKDNERLQSHPGEQWDAVGLENATERAIGTISKPPEWQTTPEGVHPPAKHKSVGASNEPQGKDFQIKTFSNQNNASSPDRRTIGSKSGDGTFMPPPKTPVPIRPRSETAASPGLSCDKVGHRPPPMLSPCSAEVSMATEGMEKRRKRDSKWQKRRISLTRVPVSPSKLGASPMHMRTPSPVVLRKESPSTVAIVAESLIELSRSADGNSWPGRSNAPFLEPETGPMPPTVGGTAQPPVSRQETVPAPPDPSQAADRHSLLKKSFSQPVLTLRENQPETEPFGSPAKRTDEKANKTKSPKSKKKRKKKEKKVSLENLDITKFLSKIKYD